MKTAISVPDAEFEHYERVARKHGLNRSEFYRRAAAHFAESLDGSSELTALADAVLARESGSTDDWPFVREAERSILSHTQW